MKKLTTILLVLLLVLGCAATSYATSDEPIKLAIVAPLTGDYAEYGLQALNAAQLAAEQVNAEGGVLGGRQIEIVEYDDRGLVDDGAAMAELIAADDSILGVPCMDFQSTVALVVGPIYQEAGIPAISNTSSHPDLSLIGEYVLRKQHHGLFEALNTIEACYLTGARKIAYIGEETDFGVSAGENMKAAVEQIAEKDPSVEWVGQTSYLTGTVDFSAQISELVALEPDIIVNSGTYEGFAPFCQQLRRSGSDIRGCRSRQYLRSEPYHHWRRGGRRRHLSPLCSTPTAKTPLCRSSSLNSKRRPAALCLTTWAPWLMMPR